MANTPNAKSGTGASGDKLYLHSGQFSTTIKTSQTVTSVETNPSGIEWDGTNTPWCGFGDDKLYLTSGQFSSTIKDSEDISGVDANSFGISANSQPGDTPWTGQGGNGKNFLTSGQFTSTIKTSNAAPGVGNTDPEGMSWDNTNTSVAGGIIDKLILSSGQFTSTIKDSELVSLLDSNPTGISFDTPNTPWCGAGNDKFFMQSAQFTSTLKTSGAGVANVNAITTDNLSGRIVTGGGGGGAAPATPTGQLPKRMMMGVGL